MNTRSTLAQSFREQCELRDLRDEAFALESRWQSGQPHSAVRRRFCRWYSGLRKAIPETRRP